MLLQIGASRKDKCIEVYVILLPIPAKVMKIEYRKQGLL